MCAAINDVLFGMVDQVQVGESSGWGGCFGHVVLLFYSDCLCSCCTIQMVCVVVVPGLCQMRPPTPPSLLKLKCS